MPDLPKPPLYAPVPKEITGLKVKHLYNMCDVEEQDAKVIIHDKKFTVEETNSQGRKNVVNFCQYGCVRLVDLNEEPHVTLEIRSYDGCAQGWKMRFFGDQDKIDTLLDALLRKKDEELMSFNLLPDDRCVHLNLKNRGLTKAQNEKMRAEATAPIPKGTKEEIEGHNPHPAVDEVTMRVVNACPAMRRTSSNRFYIEDLRVSNGEIHAIFARGMFQNFKAADFYPPRLVTPPSSPMQIFVCDSKNIWNARQAWAFETKKADAEKLLKVLMHGWMELGPSGSTSKKESSKATPRRRPIAKGGIAPRRMNNKATTNSPQKATPKKGAVKTGRVVKKTKATPKKTTKASKTTPKKAAPKSTKITPKKSAPKAAKATPKPAAAKTTKTTPKKAAPKVAKASPKKVIAKAPKTAAKGTRATRSAKK